MGGNFDFYPPLTSEPSVRQHLVRFVGGTAAVTKVYGKGMSVTYVSTGVVDLDFSGNVNNPGQFVGMVATFQATTPADVKSYVVVPGVYNTTTKKLRLSMYESGTLADLAALEWLACVVLFKVASSDF
jgi:hypothetical protein